MGFRIHLIASRGQLSISPVELCFHHESNLPVLTDSSMLAGWNQLEHLDPQL